MADFLSTNLKLTTPQIVAIVVASVVVVAAVVVVVVLVLSKKPTPSTYQFNAPAINNGTPVDVTKVFTLKDGTLVATYFDKTQDPNNPQKYFYKMSVIGDSGKNFTATGNVTATPNASYFIHYTDVNAKAPTFSNFDNMLSFLLSNSTNTTPNLTSINTFDDFFGTTKQNNGSNVYPYGNSYNVQCTNKSAALPLCK